MPRLSGGLTRILQGGKKTIQKGTAVAGNVDTTLIVPAGKRWELLNVYLTVTTDATVANRNVTVTCQDAANIPKFYNYGQTITASLTERSFFSRFVANVGQRVNALGLQILEAGEDVVLGVLTGQAGDSYDYLLEYLEIAT